MLITTKTGFLRAIQQAAGNGYFYYFQDTIDYTSLLEYVKSIHDTYDVNRTPQQAWRAGKKGLPRIKFFLHPADTDNLHVILMTTKNNEKNTLPDLRLKRYRVTIGDYRLIQKPTQNGKKSFTWALTPEATEYHIDTLKKVVRSKQDFKIRQKIAEIESLSSFSGVRDQRKRLQSVLKSESRRVFGDTLTEPYKIKNLFVRAVKIDFVVNLTRFVSEMDEKNRDLYGQLASYRRNKQRRGEVKVKKSPTAEPEAQAQENQQQEDKKTSWIKKLFG
jgi:hypothetical protein